MLRAIAAVLALASCGRYRFEEHTDGGGDAIDAPASNCGFQHIAAGNVFTCAIDKNNGVWCWGDNYNQIAGTTNRVELAAQPIALPGPAASVRAGGTFACARLMTGDVWCWGNNGTGSLGDGTATGYGPVKVALGSDTAVDLDVGGYHACIRRASDLAVVCWGDDKHLAGGQPGGGMILMPMVVAGTAGSKALALGHRHTCIVDSAGTEQCWGFGTSGRLGPGQSADTAAPVAISGAPAGAVAVAAGNRATCSIDAGKTAYCVGERYDGGAIFDRLPFTLNDVTGLAVGSYQWHALHSDGSISAVGYVSFDGVSEVSYTPVAGSLRGVTEIDGNWYHACAIANGEAVCWGSNQGGELGRGAVSATGTPTPIALPGTPDLLTVAGASACARVNGHLYCWGENYGGELGDGGTRVAYTPIELVTGLSTIDGTVIGGCAWGGGTTRCWGVNDYGENGNGQLDTTMVETPSTAQVTGATAVARGNFHTCAIVAGGNVECWGLNDIGQLGTGNTTSSTSPATVTGVSGATVLTSAGLATCVVANGQVMCWGGNAFSQLGDGTQTDRPTPVTVAVPGTAANVALGNNHACAVNTTGELYCWGQNSRGQVGVGDEAVHATPVKVTLPAAVDRLAVGGSGTCVRVVGGDVYCWGDGGRGQNATSPLSEATSPMLVPALRGAVLLARGSTGGCAVIAGEVRCWGADTLVGDDSTTRQLPVTVSCPGL